MPKYQPTKYQPADDTLLELWAIKDETAARYKTVAQYFAHLGLPQAPAHKPPSIASKPPKRAKRAVPA